MKQTADRVLKRAKKNRSMDAHERQWGLVVSQLLCEVELCQEEPEKVAILNV